MPDSRTQRKKVKSGAERQEKYKDQNPEMFKLSQEKYKFEQTKKRTEDKEFDKKLKEKEATRKRKQRKRKAEAVKQKEDKENEITIKQEPKDTNNENEHPSTSGHKVSNILFNKSEKSCQAIASLQKRRKKLMMRKIFL